MNFRPASWPDSFHSLRAGFFLEPRVFDDRVAEAVDDHRDCVHAAQAFVESWLLHSSYLLKSRVPLGNEYV
jgi:hypothetical protein